MGEKRREDRGGCQKLKKKNERDEPISLRNVYGEAVIGSGVGRGLKMKEGRENRLRSQNRK